MFRYININTTQADQWVSLFLLSCTFCITALFAPTTIKTAVISILFKGVMLLDQKQEHFKQVLHPDLNIKICL